MNDKLKAIADMLLDVEKGVAAYAFSKTGKAHLIAPLQAARRRVTKTADRIHLLETARQSGLIRDDFVRVVHTHAKRKKV